MGASPNREHIAKQKGCARRSRSPLSLTFFRRCEVLVLRHCEPRGRANARPMTGSAKQSTSRKKEWIAFAYAHRTTADKSLFRSLALSSCPGKSAKRVFAQMSRASTFLIERRKTLMARHRRAEATPSFRRLCPAMTKRTPQMKRAARSSRAAPSLKPDGRWSEALRQNIKLSFTSTQRPLLICWTWVIVLARWLVFEKTVGGELKMSMNLSPDSSASSIFCPVRSLPALFA